MLSAALSLLAAVLAAISIWLARAPSAPVEQRIGSRRASGDRRFRGLKGHPGTRQAPRRLQPGRRVWDQRRLVLGEDITAALQRERN